MNQKNPENKSDKEKKETSRRDFLRLLGAAGAATAATPLLAACAQPTPTPTPTPAAPGEAVTPQVEVGTPLRGTRIRLLLNDQANQHFIISVLDEFTQETGIIVEPEIVAFPVLLEQGEIELSSGSTNYDVTIQIFIKAQRWMRAGWSHPLDEFIASSGFDIDDYLGATTDAMRYQGQTYGIPFLAESTQMIFRHDVLEQHGLSAPNTFAELEQVLEATHNPPDFYSYVMRTQPAGVHFPFPIWLQGYGGNVFRDPPNDLTPTLNSPEALAAAENFCDLIRRFSIAGTQTYDTPDCQNAMAQGLAGLWIDALGIFPRITNPETSTVADQVSIALVPGGPVARVPQIASHGYQIPRAARNKEAAWEFIRWASSREMVQRTAIEGGFSAVPRISVLTSPEYAAEYNTERTRIGELIVDAINLSQAAYRVVPEFPEVGQRFGNALNEIISGQRSVREAMDAAQRDAEQIMVAGGNIITP